MSCPAPRCDRSYQPSLGLDERPVLPIHLVVEPAGIAEVVARAIPSPERGGCSPTVDTLPAFCRGTRKDTGLLSLYTEQRIKVIKGDPSLGGKGTQGVPLKEVQRLLWINPRF